jgi:hypothetical protein
MIDATEKPVSLTLPSLPYEHDALEPFISAATLKLHHGVHHAGYAALQGQGIHPYVTLRAAEKPSAGKIMRRILRRIADGHTGDLGDVTTLADPAVVQDLLRERRHEARA